MWLEAGLQGVPPDASNKSACEALLFDLWRPGGLEHPRGAMDLLSDDAACLVWRAKLCWLQNHWLQHVHYDGCFAKADACKSKFPLCTNDVSRVVADVAGLDGGEPEVLIGLGGSQDQVLDLTAAQPLPTGSGYGGGSKRKTGTSSRGAEAGGSKWKKTGSNAAQPNRLAEAEAGLLDLTVPQPNCTEPVLASGKRKATVAAREPKKKARRRSVYVDDEAQGDTDSEEAQVDSDEEDGDEVCEPCDPVGEAASNRLFDSQREAIEAAETLAYVQRCYLASAANGAARPMQVPQNSVQLRVWTLWATCRSLAA
jgi:hypothetical protein